MTEQTLSEDLKGFTGTDSYYKHWSRAFTYTDGVKHLCERAGAYWLIDLIASYQKEWRQVTFQVWQLYKNESEAKVTMREDSTNPVLVEQRIIDTDFPLDYCELWLIDGVLLLPSEY